MFNRSIPQAAQMSFGVWCLWIRFTSYAFLRGWREQVSIFISVGHRENTHQQTKSNRVANHNDAKRYQVLLHRKTASLCDTGRRPLGFYHSAQRCQRKTSKAKYPDSPGDELLTVNYSERIRGLRQDLRAIGPIGSRQTGLFGQYREQTGRFR